MVDEQGRLFGRVNLFDALVGLVVLGLVPLAYGAYVLFRTPEPRLTAIEPAVLVKGPNLRVKVTGANFRPYMRVSFGTMQGNTFVFRSTSEALVDLNPMEAGVYDVVLFDTAQERSRLPKAFTLLPSPLPNTRLLLVGNFGNLTAERAKSVVAGMPLTGIGEVVQVAAPLPELTRVVAGPVVEVPIKEAVRVPAIVQVACNMQSPQGVPQCLVGDVVLQPTSLMLVDTPLGKLPFQVDQVRGTDPVETIEIVVDVAGRADVLAGVRAGDVDHGTYFNPLAGGARVAEVGPLKPSGESGRFDVKLSAQAQRGSGSWIYGSAPLKVGLPFVLRTPRYEVQGTVVRLTPPWPGTSSAK